MPKQKIIIKELSKGGLKATLYYKFWFLFWMPEDMEVGFKLAIKYIVKHWKLTYRIDDEMIFGLELLEDESK